MELGQKYHYLIDGGPTKKPHNAEPVHFFDNATNESIIKLDGIMVTHPDGDHVDGILELFNRFQPNKHPNAEFLFKGPLLLTKAFFSKTTTTNSKNIKDM